MTISRDAFLQRVRQAVAEGNRPGAAADLEARGTVGYQGAGADPVARFCQELTTAGGVAHVVPDRQTTVARVLQLVQEKSARRILVGRGALLESLNLPERLRGVGVEVATIEALAPETSRAPFFGADLGISGVDYLVAETGSVALLARRDEPRSLSLLPPVHIAVAERSQIIPDLFDLFDAVSARAAGALPSCLSLITGPSKTGDIELRLVTGVHGPGEIHVVLINA